VLMSGPLTQRGTAADTVDTVDEAQEEFLELICADEQLLRAEFDAIIAQEWDTPSLPPGPPRRSSFPARPPQRRRCRTGRPANQLTGPQHDPGGEGRCRERGPPAGPRESSPRQPSPPTRR